MQLELVILMQVSWWGTLQRVLDDDQERWTLLYTPKWWEHWFLRATEWLSDEATLIALSGRLDDDRQLFSDGCQLMIKKDQMDDNQWKITVVWQFFISSDTITEMILIVYWKWNCFSYIQNRDMLFFYMHSCRKQKTIKASCWTWYTRPRWLLFEARIHYIT